MMKSTLILTFLFFALLGCAPKKSAVKSNFKIIVGAAALGTPMNGGVFLETHDLALTTKNIVKLDAENSATIPTGRYNLKFVAFTGPSEKTGSMYCGSVDEASLLSEMATISVTINQSNCNDAKYEELISKLVGNSKWDSAKFDQGKWGP